MASLLVLLMLASAALASSAAGLRVGLTRIRSDPDLTPSELMREALRRDKSRHARFRRELASSDVTVAAPVHMEKPGGSSYLMNLSVGTPPLAFQAIVDTGSSLIMTNCSPSCGNNTKCLDPRSSSTYAELPCNSPLRAVPDLCNATDGAANSSSGSSCPCTGKQKYFDEGWASYRIGTETFTFGLTEADQVPVADIAFGCIDGSSPGWGSAGIVGLNRGKLSLVSQMGAGKFSYCLTPPQDASSMSTLLIGPSAAINGTGADIRSTPFVTGKDYYYLNLKGISLGSKELSIPPEAFPLRTGNRGGVFIDSGWTTTTLVDEAYQEVRAEVLSLVALPPVDAQEHTTLELCFNLTSDSGASTPPPAMPNMTLHFEGADMVLPPDNYMFLDSSWGVWCLCMQNTTADAGSALGNYQQQNIQFLYDLDNEMLSFAPAQCSTL